MFSLTAAANTYPDQPFLVAFQTPRAKEVSIFVVRVFVNLREMLSTHEGLKKKIEAMEKKYDQQFQIVFEAIKQLLETEAKPRKIYPVKFVRAAI